MVPGEDGARLRARWDEFEARETPEARFAHSVDRLAPLLLNHANHGELWAEYGITADRVLRVQRAHRRRLARSLGRGRARSSTTRSRNGWFAE